MLWVLEEIEKDPWPKERNQTGKQQFMFNIHYKNNNNNNVEHNTAPCAPP